MLPNDLKTTQPIFGRVKGRLIGSQRNIYTDTDPEIIKIHIAIHTQYHKAHTSNTSFSS